jgi:stage III sporulation protein AH
MFSLIVRRRTLYFILMVLSGFAVLASGWLDIPGKSIKGENVTTINTEAPGLNKTQNNRDQSGEPVILDIEQNSGKKSNQDESEFFIEYRLDRERTRGQQIELLREIINNPASSPQARQQAQERLLAISNKMAKEIEIEHLIRARGFKDSTVCLEENGVTVIVQAANLSTQDTANICEVVSWGTGVGDQNIIIIPKN